MTISQQTEFSRLRQQAGLSVEDLAETLDCSPRTLYRYKRGRNTGTQICGRSSM